MRTPAFLLATVLVASPLYAADPLSLVASPSSPVEERIVAFAQSEFVKRGVAVQRNGRADSATTVVVVGTPAEMKSLLSPAALQRWKLSPGPSGEEGFAAVSIVNGNGTTLVLTANTPRGELFALGWVLRTTDMSAGTAHLSRTARFATAPDKAVRGYQIGYRMKNNTYDAWTLAQFKDQMLDMAAFGLNTMQVVAPVSDDDLTSPLYPAPALDTVVGLSEMSQQYGLRFDLYYPEMAKDYRAPNAISAELAQFEELVKRLPLVDSLHVPGGDPGHTAPEVLMPIVEQEAHILHKYHPQATVWLSAQGFSGEQYDTFYRMMAAHPRYIQGIFFGPQSRESLEQQRAKIPSEYPVEFYPDTAHTMHSQFPVPEWDPVYALTESREPICPRPADFDHIYHHYRSKTSGFLVYSEGVNDDVNKILWAGWGWNPKQTSKQTLTEYARYFFNGNGAESARIADSIIALEQNWRGPILHNTGIGPTLAAFESMHPPLAAKNWRWDSLLYRAIYDRYLQIKRARELGAEDASLKQLRVGGAAAIPAALRTLHTSAAQAEEVRLHTQLAMSAAALFKEAGMQLSVKLYGATNWERGANFDRVDTPLNNRTWMEARLGEAAKMNGPGAEQAVRDVVDWERPVPDALYDDLGDPEKQPHLVKGQGWLADPEMYHTAINSIADQTLEHGWRFSTLTYEETLYETPLRMLYKGLTAKPYRVRIIYAGEEYKLPMKLTANGTLIHDFRLRTSNPEEVEFDIPAGVVRDGTLTLEWTRRPGAGGGGRGGQVASVWLLPAK